MKKPCRSCGKVIRSKGSLCRPCYLRQNRGPDRDHPWRHEPIDPRKPPAPKEAPKEIPGSPKESPKPKKKAPGRPREIVFRGTLEECRLHHRLIRCYEADLTFRYEIIREDPEHHPGLGDPE